MLNVADEPRTTGPGGPGRSGPADRPVRAWPLLILAMPAAVAVWSGWVGIGQMTGFGVVRPLPGIWDSLQVDTAVTLPVGVEAYAAMALHAWLAQSRTVRVRTRLFARRSAIGSLALGMAGQVAYHLLAEAHVMRAPWEVTTLVASLPVLVLGLGTALAQMLRADAAVVDQGVACGDRPGLEARPADRDCPDGTALADRPLNRGPAEVQAAAASRLGEARSAAEALTAAGQRVSRRSLRAAGVRGSNAELSDTRRPRSTTPWSRSRAGNPSRSPSLPRTSSIPPTQTLMRSGSHWRRRLSPPSAAPREPAREPTDAASRLAGPRASRAGTGSRSGCPRRSRSPSPTHWRNSASPASSLRGPTG
jgi:hypothetical protein